MSLRPELLRALSPVVLIRAVLDRIEAYGKAVNAYITWDGAKALEAARRAEDAVMRGRPLGPLHGIPVAVKDLVFTADHPTTGGTRILKECLPREDATIIRRLADAGSLRVRAEQPLAHPASSARPVGPRGRPQSAVRRQRLRHEIGDRRPRP